jgi:hypothetical protein
MKKIFWFTHTNIDTRKCASKNIFKTEEPSVSIDLSEYLKLFYENEIWKRKKYRTEYSIEYTDKDFQKIKSFKIHLHSENWPYSNEHSYEEVIKKYVDIKKIETSKITSSNIGVATQLAVIEVEIETSHKIIDYVTHEEEKDVNLIFDKRLSSENVNSWRELSKFKSIICEFLQFYCFNMHLNFLSKDYWFSFTNKPILSGFTIFTDFESYYYETDAIDFLSHYIFYEYDKDILHSLMTKTSQFWHRELPSIHFFLESLKGTHITINNFSKLVFTLETFFSDRVSNDFMTLTIPLLICKDINSMKTVRATLKKCFEIRNNYVHGKEITSINSQIKKNSEERVEDYFYELKNIIIHIFLFYINNDLYLEKNNEKINPELIFRFFPNGIN